MALAIQEHLGGPDGFFPRIEQVELRVASLTVGPGLMSTGPQEAIDGWHLKSEDGGWTAALMPGHLSLETTKYTIWSDFEGRLTDLVEAVARSASPVMEQRLGLRYVDRLVGLGVASAGGWSRWIEGAILGPPLHEVLGGAVRSTRQQIDLDLGDGHLCVLRHGTVTDDDAAPGEESTYLLDFDVYRSQSRRFSPDGVAGAARAFHEKADALFQQVITDELLELLGSDQNG